LTANNTQPAHNPALFNSRSVLRLPSLSFLILTGLLSLSACSEQMVPAGITGYNHTKDRSLISFTVNGAMGSNLAPESGGGKESCCVSIPKTWRPGLKATIAWQYQGGTEIPPPPPPQQKIIEIPEYKNAGRLWVHFYDNHQVKLVVSPCNIEHPYYPMSAKDKLPWVDSGTKEDVIESHNKGGDTLDCE